MTNTKLKADFNGLFSEGILCLSHGDACLDEFDNEVVLKAGMVATAFDLDSDEHGQSDNLIASGIVEPSPDWLQCNGSKWVLKIDKNGVRHESDVLSDK